MSPARVALAILLLPLFLSAAPSARATLARGFTLPELVAEADAILEGVIVDQEILVERGEVYTLSWLEVRAAWQGEALPGELVAIRQLGGVLDGIERRVPGVGRLALGDALVAFTRTDGAFHYLIGLGQGAFHLAGRDLARRDRPQLVAAPGPLRPLAPDLVSRDALRAEVQALQPRMSLNNRALPGGQR